MCDRQVRYLLVPVLVFVAQASDTMYLADFWHHLARGEVIHAEGRLLDHDIFTFTVRGAPFRDVNWLSQWIYAWLFGIGGLALVQTVNALILALTLGLLVQLCRRRSGSLVVAMSVGLAVFLGLWQVLTVRPQTFSLALFVGFLALLDQPPSFNPGSQDRAEPCPPDQDSRQSVIAPLLALPLLEALWTNLHGAFPMGIALVGCFGLAELIRAVRCRTWTRRLTVLSISLVLCGAATLLNPYGADIYQYVGVTSQRAKERGIDEWLAPSFDQGIGLAFFISLPVLAAVIVLAWRKRRQTLSLEEAILLLVFLPLAAFSIRMVAWWLLVLTLPLTGLAVLLVPPARDEVEPRPSFGASLTVAVLALLAIFSTPWLAPVNPLLRWKMQPRLEQRLHAALEQVKGAAGPRRVFTRLEWGEYVAWSGWPDAAVFMDGRIEIYPDAVWDAYSRITQAQPGWQEALERYKVDVLILDTDYHSRFGLIQAAQSCGWSEIFASGRVRVLTRGATARGYPVDGGGASP
ncbi:MAG: hypothetical protein U0793_05170 [Gemmataceae bacterium]